jgi:hypothetical protein
MPLLLPFNIHSFHASKYCASLIYSFIHSFKINQGVIRQLAGRWLLYSTSFRFFVRRKSGQKNWFFQEKKKTIRQPPNARLNG